MHRVVCPQCNKKYQVEKPDAAKLVRCKCGIRFNSVSGEQEHIDGRIVDAAVADMLNADLLDSRQSFCFDNGEPWPRVTAVAVIPPKRPQSELWLLIRDVFSVAVRFVVFLFISASVVFALLVLAMAVIAEGYGPMVCGAFWCVLIIACGVALGITIAGGGRQ